MTINETVLEMHFHRPLMDLFRETLGVGATGSLEFYKYSPQKEVFVGFDQAYVKTELGEDEFFRWLKRCAKSDGYRLNDKFIGYFLQFKVVREMTNQTKHTPVMIRSSPHYRVSLSTDKNRNTGISQHELLYRLARNPGALVYYACPMLFDRTSLYDVNIDLDQLRLADLDSCPGEYSDNDHHSIYYDDRNAPPIWCSDPVEGVAINPSDFAADVRARLQDRDVSDLAGDLLSTLSNLDQLGLSGTEDFFKPFESSPSIPKLLGGSLTILRYSEGGA